MVELERELQVYSTSNVQLRKQLANALLVLDEHGLLGYEELTTKVVGK